MKSQLDFVHGGGDMGELLRRHDWTQTSVGAPETWPQSLRTAIRLMLNTRHPMFIFWGQEGSCFYNDAYRQSIGPERHPGALGKPAFAVWEEIWDVIGPQIEQVMAGRGATWHENQLVPITRHGRYEQVYWTYSYSPIDDEHSSSGVGGVLVVCTETTQAVLASSRYRFLSELGDSLRGVATPQDVMAKTAQLLGEYLKASCVGYSEIDSTGTYVTVERDWTSSSGHSVVGRHRLSDYGFDLMNELQAGRSVAVDDLNHSELLSETERTAYSTIRTSAFIDVPIVKRERCVGILFVLSETARNWTANEILLVENVAERTWEAVERSRAEAALHVADRRKDEFLAMLAHELRNPLAPISAAAELLKLGTLHGQGIKQTSEVIARQVVHMTSLVDDLLDVSRVTRRMIKLENVLLNVKQILSDAVEQVAPLLRSRRHSFTLQQPPDNVIVRGDKKRLVQVIANILNNAAKYTPEGGNIFLQCDLDEHQLRIEVRDDGIGMLPELMSRVFDLFAQAERSSDRSSGGLGLGLALAKNLVELHGGTLNCFSEGLGRGSRFVIAMPCVRESRPALLPSFSEEKPSLTDQPFRVLVVDDNIDAASMLAMWLEAAGHEVLVEFGSRRALARAQLEEPDICLLDIGLPELDGNELARSLRRNPKTQEAVLVAVSGYGQENDRRISLAAGFDHYLVKPVDTHKLSNLFLKIRMGRKKATCS